MITGIYGNKKEVTCDNCGEGFDAVDWEYAMSKMKRDGWTTKRVDNHTEHYCDQCNCYI